MAAPETVRARGGGGGTLALVPRGRFVTKVLLRERRVPPAAKGPNQFGLGSGHWRGTIKSSVLQLVKYQGMAEVSNTATMCFMSQVL